jgi:guanine nucleotide-binding protein alpha-1 subunit
VTIILDVLGREMSMSKSRPHARVRSSTSQIKNAGKDDTFWFDFVEKHKILRLRLQPLFRIQMDLERRLGSASIDEPYSSSFAVYGNQDTINKPNPRRPAEFFVTTQKGWKSTLDRALPIKISVKKDEMDDIVEVIAGCGPDIKELWADPVVRAVLKKHEITLEHSSGL